MRSRSRESPVGPGVASGVNAEWRKLFGLLPGYDPEATRADCRFDPAIADRVCAFFPAFLTHVEGELAGRSLDLRPWQRAVIGCAFGWRRPDGRRRYREVFQYVPRGNGKTCLVAGLVVLVAFCDGEPGAQLYSAAADREQAALVYRTAKGMVLQNAELSARTKVHASFKSLEFPGGNVYRALSAEADTKHGFNSHFVIVDELHAQPNRDLVDVLLTSTGKRRQPLVWHITTADFDRPSICNEKYAEACRVRDNGGDPAKPGYDPYLLPVIYEADAERDDWADPAAWAKANPNLGVSVPREYLERECKKAQEVPGYENTFKRLHLNMRTQTAVRWLRLDDWDRGNDGAGGGGETPAAWRERVARLLAGRTCRGALDLSSKTDLTAWVLLFPPPFVGDPWYVLPRFFAPRDCAERRERRDKVPYLVWERQGFVTLTPGNVVDYDAIKARVLADAREFDLVEVAYDPWNATQIALQLQAEGCVVKEFQQGYKSMSEPTKELEKLVLAGQVAHGGNPVMRWMAGNASIDRDPAGNVKPSKAKSTERIDGIVTLVMALGLAMVADPHGTGRGPGVMLLG